MLFIFTHGPLLPPARQVSNFRSEYTPLTAISKSRRAHSTKLRCSLQTSHVPSTTPAPRRIAISEHSVVALRGLSDVACVAIVRDIFAVGSLSVGLCSTELLLGGLVGLWTAAAFALRGMRNSVFHGIISSPRSPSVFIAPSKMPPDAPPPLSVPPYTTNSRLLVHEVYPAVTLLHALDELETASSAILLWTLAKSSDMGIRKALAESLAEFPVCANAPLAVASALAMDREYEVAVRGTQALYAFADLIQIENSHVFQASDTLQQRRRQRHWEEETIFLESGNKLGTNSHNASTLMGNLALLSLALLDGESTSLADTIFSMGEGNTKVSTKRNAFLKFVPLLDALNWEEIRGICAVAAIPILYEAYSIWGNGNLPLRFIGLGWVCALAGLVAYPRSASLWQRFQHACVVDCARV